MPKPKCPQCSSTNVVPSLAKNSHNNCVACGYTDFVAHFYREQAEHHKPGDRVQTNGNFGEGFCTIKASDPIPDDYQPIGINVLGDPPATFSARRTKPFSKSKIVPTSNAREPCWWEKD